MKLFSISVIALTATSALAQAPKTDAPPVLERLCGKLEHVEDFPVKNELQTFTTKVQNLSHVPVRLFPAANDAQCCEGRVAAASTTTGHWGSFEIKPKKLSGGIYWLQVEPNGREYHMLIQYEPKRYSDQFCSKTVWQVNDAGKFWKTEFIEVD